MAPQTNDKWTDVGHYVPNHIPVETANAVWQKLDAALHPEAANKSYRTWLLAVASVAATLLVFLVVFVPRSRPKNAKVSVRSTAAMATQFEQKLVTTKKAYYVINNPKKVNYTTISHPPKKVAPTNQALETSHPSSTTVLSSKEEVALQPTLQPFTETTPQETTTITAKRRVIHVDDIAIQKTLVDIQKTANQKRIFPRMHHDDIPIENMPHTKQKLFPQLVNDWQQP
ncbi:MAG: hypothetical protein EAZ47_03480 [Bacteroidetes bacterium]|nr:MAG: hypothetical protein EAZ47_03480 [Bacteroidota bacterium]